MLIQRTVAGRGSPWLISTALPYWLSWWLGDFLEKEVPPCTAGARTLSPSFTPVRKSVEGDTHPVKALGLEEVAVGSVQLPPSSGSTAVDGF